MNPFRVIFQHLKSNKSLLALCLALCAFYKIWRRRFHVLGAAAIGPYPNVMIAPGLRWLQNTIMSWTRKDLSFTSYPLDSLETSEPKRNSDNGHPLSGAVRDAARRMIDGAAIAMGREIFEISPAKQSNCKRSMVQYYAVGDLDRLVNDDTPRENDVIVAIDIDYYLRDVGEILAFGKPCLIHTFQPISVAGVDGDSHFTISNNFVDYQVGNGGRWKHRVYDWSAAGEFIESVKPGWRNWLLQFVGLEEVIYTKIHHSRPWKTCPHRLFVWTIPQFSVVKIKFAPTNLTARKLRYVDYQDRSRPGWNSLVYVGQNLEKRIVLGREGEDAVVDLAKEQFDVLMGLASAQSVTSRMIGMGLVKTETLALVAQYYRRGRPDEVDRPLISRSMTPKVHWPLTCEAELPEVSARAYGRPLVTDHYLMPMIKRWEAMSLSIDRRVTFYHNAEVPVPEVQRYAREFIELLVPLANVGVPYGLEECAEKLDKQSQVLALKQVWETVDMSPQEKIESFMKNEPCMKSARIISAYPDIRYLLSFSMFTLKFRDDVLHDEVNSWFHPGLTPKEIAERVLQYVSNVDRVGETDFENLDGTTSKWMQLHLYGAALKRHFRVEYHGEIDKYLGFLLNIPAYAKRFNFKYEPGVGVKSGSPPTCDENTVNSAFEEYCAIRKTYPHLDPIVVYRMIGPKFGDDGLTRHDLQKGHVWACKKLGLRMKYEECKLETGVVYLARVYPDPWTTSTTFQDPLRTWRKIHLTSRDPNVPLETAAVDRMEGYLVTDGLTPVTGNYANMVVRTCNVLGDKKRDNRKCRFREKPYWLTLGGSWPQAEEDIPLMRTCISARVGISEAELLDLEAMLDKADSPWAIRPLDRSEEDCPYKDTLDSEALPVNPVDARQYEQDEQQRNLRANPETTKSNGKSRDGANGGPVNPRLQRPGRKERSGKFPSVPKVHPGENRERGDRVIVEAKGGSGTSRRSSSSRRGGGQVTTRRLEASNKDIGKPGRRGDRRRGREN